MKSEKKIVQNFAQKISPIKYKINYFQNFMKEKIREKK